MPWQNNNGGGGGWKSGGGNGGGPWGQGPQGPRGGGGGQNQPDLEEIFKRGQDHLKNAIPGGTGVPSWLWVFAFAVAWRYASDREDAHLDTASLRETASERTRCCLEKRTWGRSWTSLYCR